MNALETTLLHYISIAVELNSAFDFVRTPGHWPNWHPSSLRLYGDVNRRLGVGDSFEEDICAAGRKARLRWQVVTCVPPTLWTAHARADNGVLLQLSYRLAQHGDRVHFKRELSYRVSGWWLNLLNFMLLRRRIAAESKISLSQLRTLLEREF
ncbi:MAG: SRPBCC family protein [Pseudomonadota bacterium]|nr:SRPBCC family protein [Pseudomonadota bacterium]